MRAVWIFLIICAATAGWFGGGTRVLPVNAVNDISWPQCGTELAKATSGIVGVTGGLALRPNPCLSQQAANFRLLSVYVNTGYPGPDIKKSEQLSPKSCAPGDRICMAYDYGFNSGLYDFNLAMANGVVAKNWWLDVETENSWDNDFRVNRANIEGTIDALSNSVGRQNIGIYSYPGQWNLLMNNWKNSYPAWVATGSSNYADAVQACKAPSFNGGRTVLAQYTSTFDVDIICD